MGNEQPTFLVHFRPEPRIDGIRALRQLLKAALRRFGLRAIHVAEIKQPGISQTKDD
jgi:hypothetical protein